MFRQDDSEHARLLVEVHRSLQRHSITDVTTALKLLGLYHRRLAQYRLARASFAAAVELAKRQEDPIEQLNTLFWLGVVERYLGNLDVAERVHRDQLTLARKAGQPGQIVLAEENLGLVALRRGQVAEARGLVIRALNRAQQIEDRELQAFCYHALMVVELEAGRPGEAAACGWEAYVRYESTEQKVRALQDCGALLLEARLTDAARAAHEIVVHSGADAAVRIRSQIGLVELAAAEHAHEHFERDAKALLDSESLLEGLPYEAIRAHRALGIAYATFDNDRRARMHLSKACSIADEKGFEAEASELRDQLASLPEMLELPLSDTTGSASTPAAELAMLKNVGNNIMAERARLSA
jgi:tetratricopeptide (TPR) repeat protein